MSQIDVWRAGGPSNSVMTGLEGGSARSVSAKTLSKLDLALQWEPGSARRVYEDGGEPTELAGRGPSQSTPLFPGGTADAKRIINEAAEAMRQPGTTLGDLDETTRAFFDKVAQLATINGLVGAVENPEHPQSLAAIRASFRENIGRTGVTPDLVRTVAAGRLGDVVEQLNDARRAQVVELAYRLLDEQEAAGRGEDAGDVAKHSDDDLAARRDSNSQVSSIRNVVDDDDPTAGIDPAQYAAHPRTEPLEEDNPTP